MISLENIEYYSKIFIKRYVIDNQLIFSSSAVSWKLIHSSMIFHQDLLRARKRVLMKDHSNYELISKTQHLKKKSVDYLFYPIDRKIQTSLLQLSR